MTAPVALLTVPESSLAASLRSRIEARGIDCRVLDLDAPRHGKPVTIGPRNVMWEGIDLLSLGALLLERPIFPWPQPSMFSGLPDDETARSKAVAAEREARSLGLSAIRIAGDAILVVNPPRASHLAAIPATAMDVAWRAGVPMMPWRLGPLALAGKDAVILDPAGRDRAGTRLRSGAEDTVLALEAPEGEVAALLVIGNKATAAIGYEHARAWASAEVLGERPEWIREPALREVALRAAQALTLPLLEVLVSRESNPRVLFIDAAPDLVAWGERTQGLALDALIDYLIRGGKP